MRIPTWCLINGRQSRGIGRAVDDGAKGGGQEKGMSVSKYSDNRGGGWGHG
ncbi:Hypothetical predicted protein [Olea europaea subsp. europaea]|uniref:Uncharacterized protein n=1 Tax=Olea europaea subsp. europaea TaxID=158383 RepID=A0A8S0SBL2_OLEEU|nr:Hypothetical predicted protein [Olea europaea subsp. europaea]